MNDGSKNPDIQGVAKQFLSKRIDWVEPGSPFYDKDYMGTVGRQMPAPGTPPATLESMVDMVTERVIEPAAARLAKDIARKAPELADMMKGLTARAYADAPEGIDEALADFKARRAGHAAMPQVETLHEGLKRYRNELAVPLDRAQMMMTRAQHLVSLPLSISLRGKTLDSDMMRGAEALATLGDGFLRLKNELQDAFRESPTRLVAERAFSDADDVLRTIAGDARKLAAMVAQARSGRGEGLPPPPSAPPH